MLKPVRIAFLKVINNRLLHWYDIWNKIKILTIYARVNIGKEVLKSNCWVWEKKNL